MTVPAYRYIANLVIYLTDRKDRTQLSVLEACIIELHSIPRKPRIFRW